MIYYAFDKKKKKKVNFRCLRLSVVSKYKTSKLEHFGSPVIILAASSCFQIHSHLSGLSAYDY
jgi:hypothetical protein